MRFGLKEKEILAIQNVFSMHPEITCALLYGSRAQGNYRLGSDIDLVLQGKSLSHRLLNRISLELDNLMLPYTFDLSIYEAIDNPELLQHIQEVEQNFYQKSSIASGS